jgi:GT2 family glycosyltransferase
MDPKVSIIIVNFNVKDLIDSCINSIQTYCNEELYEIIVVDNNSSDGSVELIKTIYPKVKVIECKENNGFAKANNIGFEHSVGEYILLLNPDTEFVEDSLTPILSLMQENLQYGAIGCKLLNTDKTLQPSCFDFPSNLNFFTDHTGLSKFFPSLSSLKRKIDYNIMHEVDFVRGAFLMTRKSIINEHGFLDNQYFMYAEETDYCFKLQKFGHKVIYSPTTRVIHHQGQSSKQVNVKMFIERYKSLFKFFNKNKSGFNVHLFKLNCFVIFSIGIIFYKIIGPFNNDEASKKYYKDKIAGIKGVIKDVVSERA